MLSMPQIGNTYAFQLLILFFNGNTCAFLCRHNVFGENTSACPILFAYLHENTYTFPHIFANSIVNTLAFQRNFQNVPSFLAHSLPLQHPGPQTPLFWFHLLPSLSQEGHGPVILHSRTLSHVFFFAYSLETKILPKNKNLSSISNIQTKNVTFANLLLFFNFGGKLCYIWLNKLYISIKLPQLIT